MQGRGRTKLYEQCSEYTKEFTTRFSRNNEIKDLWFKVFSFPEFFDFPSSIEKIDGNAFIRPDYVIGKDVSETVTALFKTLQETDVLHRSNENYEKYFNLFYLSNILMFFNIFKGFS